MIARYWKGWTKTADADSYERLLKERVFPELGKIMGYCGGYILRRDSAHEAEFIVMNLFESLDALKQFAGEEYEIPVFEPEAKKLLSRVEPQAVHYEVKASPRG